MLVNTKVFKCVERSDGAFYVVGNSVLLLVIATDKPERASKADVPEIKRLKKRAAV